MKYFVAVAEAGGFGTAAQRMHISQPPLTRQIQALERDIGAKLFERTARGVELTAAGKVFLDDARQLLALVQRSSRRSQAAARGESGELKLVYFGTPVFETVPAFVRTFLATYPDATVAVSHMTKEAQLESLLSGVVDIGFGRFYPVTEGVSSWNIGTETLHVAAADPWDTRVSRARAVVDLLDVPLILYPRGDRPSFADKVVSIFRTEGVEPKIAAEVEDVTTALALTAAGIGATLVPASVAHVRWPGVTFLELEPQKLSVPVSCVFRTDRRGPIVDSALQVVASLTKGMSRR
ncbi:LysR substrate-binding domain-containing protein [Cupriavidus oxalaticus]|uniref:LysR substrate-binding domain-containing protein n=1 Tax=Cupriavidus oxalaticus TaxID=96344 RepID=UPI001F0DD9C8|nr:LysR substrate-binding domain-containing protein [Cupriavidus oxalaticus]